MLYCFTNSIARPWESLPKSTLIATLPIGKVGFVTDTQGGTVYMVTL